MKTLIKNTTIFDGDKAVLHSASVLFDKTGILAVGENIEAYVSEAETVIDGRGKYVIPGLIDCHVHMSTGLGDDNVVAAGAAAAFHAQNVL